MTINSFLRITFQNYVAKKASRKIHALSTRVATNMNVPKRHILINAIFKS